MPDEQKLLPCPFCGAQPYTSVSKNVARIGCNECGPAPEAIGYDRGDVAGFHFAKKEWDRRHPLPGVVTLSGEEAGKIKEALEEAAGCAGKEQADIFCEALRILTRAQKEG